MATWVFAERFPLTSPHLTSDLYAPASGSTQTHALPRHKPLLESQAHAARERPRDLLSGRVPELDQGRLAANLAECEHLADKLIFEQLPKRHPGRVGQELVLEGLAEPARKCPLDLLLPGREHDYRRLSVRLTELDHLASEASLQQRCNRRRFRMKDRRLRLFSDVFVNAKVFAVALRVHLSSFTNTDFPRCQNNVNERREPRGSEMILRVPLYTNRLFCQPPRHSPKRVVNTPYFKTRSNLVCDGHSVSINLERAGRFGEFEAGPDADETADGTPDRI